MRIETIISWGFVDLIEIFFKANNLICTCSIRSGEGPPKITIEYEDESDTSIAITFMSMRHLGFENMLCDYIKKCGYDTSMISVGRTVVKRDMKKLDEEWEVYRREKLGFR